MKKLCNQRGCRETVPLQTPYCSYHSNGQNDQARERAAQDKKRRPAGDSELHNKYQRKAWKVDTTNAFKASNPICQAITDGQQCRYPVEVLHHLRDPREDDSRFYDWDNIKGLCKFHHNPHKRGEPEEVLANLDKYFAPTRKPSWMTRGFGSLIQNEPTPLG